MPSCVSVDQTRATDLITGSCEPQCGLWELNSGPIEETVSALKH